MGTFLGFKVLRGSREGGGGGDGHGGGGEGGDGGPKWWDGDIIEVPHARVVVTVCIAIFLSVFTAVRTYSAGPRLLRDLLSSSEPN